MKNSHKREFKTELEIVLTFDFSKKKYLKPQIFVSTNYKINFILSNAVYTFEINCRRALFIQACSPFLFVLFLCFSPIN